MKRTGLLRSWSSPCFVCVRVRVFAGKIPALLFFSLFFIIFLI